MELKFEQFVSDWHNSGSSNCTFMELKYAITIKTGAADLFKLYLYGIEILDWRRKQASIPWFKLYLYGIEINLLAQVRCLLSKVQIVPLWN